MSVLSKAINEEQWELASLCLLLGLTRALAKIPPDSLYGMLEVLEGPQHPEGNHGA